MNGKHRTGPLGPSDLLRTIGLGLLVLVVGLGLALLLLPEWKTDKFRPESFYRHRFRDVAARAGLTVEPGLPQVRLGTSYLQASPPYQALGEQADEWLLATGSAVPVEVVHLVTAPDGRKLRLFTELTPDGRCWVTALWPRDFMTLASLTAAPGAARKPGRAAGSLDDLARAMLGPEERLGTAREVVASTFAQSLTWRFFPILPAGAPGAAPGATPGVINRAPAQHLTAMNNGPQLLYRGPGDARRMSKAELTRKTRTSFGLQGFSMMLWPVLGAALFVALLAWRRMGAGVGAVLAFASLATATTSPNWFMGLSFLSFLPAFFQAATVFFLWSSAESLLRSRRLDFTTSLDSLRAGRLGPRGGRALLNGFGYGSGVAGLQLGLAALAVALPGVSPGWPVPELPVFRLEGGPITEGVVLGAGVALGSALASRFLPPRWELWGATAFGAWFVPLLLHPLPASIVARMAIAGVLVYALRTHGLTALLAAALTAALLPTAVWTGLHAGFVPGSFALTAGLAAAIVVLGVVGLQRPAEVDAVATPPRFVRRLEESRRRRYETDLLARMHAGMLPARMPEIPGCEVAARAVLSGSVGGNLYDVLRDEEGGVWVASGDVLGQGYACSIAQAMVKAALHSLAAAGTSPAEVLRQTSEVLRGVDPQRNVATLVLVRIVPQTGECRLANAGHPTPLLVPEPDDAAGGAGGLQDALRNPGPRLGEEATEGYREVAFTLPPGGLLAFVSETLYEERDRKGVPFGVANAREALAGKTAEAALEALLAAWRRHVGPGPPSDDTTIVVVRREGSR